jgi:HAD superfamily hydrolase (TIGR01509 family)
MQAVVLDMDGVIVDSECHWKEVESSFLRRLLPKWNDELSQQIIGLSMYDAHDLLRRKHQLEMQLDDFVGFYQSLADDIYGKQVSLLPGVHEFIVEVHENHIPLALASSSPIAWINTVLERFSLRDYFAEIASAEHLNGRGKPFPDVYLLVAERLGIAPSLCVAIEDSQKGVRAAKDAGMVCVGLRNGFNAHQDLRQADLVVNGFGEISLGKLRKL